MLWSYVTGLAAVVGVMLAWVAVQGAWRRAFPDAVADPDVLAGRMGCHSCTGSDCDGGRCLVERRKMEPRAVEDRPMEEPQIERDGRIVAAVEEIP